MTDMDNLFERELSRRRLLKVGAGIGGAFVASPLLAACGSDDGGSDLKGSGKVIIGAFEDAALEPFKEKMIPLFKKDTGIKIEFLVEEYGTFFEKAFNDGQSKAGQYDVYIMDDPWIPQYAAAGILLDLGKEGLKPGGDFIGPWIDLGYWPPKQGPRIKGFEDKEPALIAVPSIGDLQTLTYRNDIYSSAPKTYDELVSVAEQKMDRAKKQYGFVFRGVAGNPIVTSWYPVFLSFGGEFFDDKWNVLFNNEKGKAAAEFFVTTLKSLAPPGVVEFDSDQEGAAILGGEAFSIIQYSGNALKSDDSKESKEVGKLDFATVPKQEKAIAQSGIFISGVSTSAPNQENAVKFMKWFAQTDIQTQLARAGSLPVKRPSFEDKKAQEGNRLMSVALEQIDSGIESRPRTPDWGKVEELLGVQLNKALQKGKLGNELDVAADQVTAYLKKQGYYS